MSDDTLLTRIHSLHAASLDTTQLHAGYPTELKALVTEYTRRCRERGSSWADIGETLPVSSTTARTWMNQAAGEQGGLVPVTIKEEEPSPRAAPALLLTSPRGFQLSGLTLEQAAQLLGHLG